MGSSCIRPNPYRRNAATYSLQVLDAATKESGTRVKSKRQSTDNTTTSPTGPKEKGPRSLEDSLSYFVSSFVDSLETKKTKLDIELKKLDIRAKEVESTVALNRELVTTLAKIMSKADG